MLRMGTKMQVVTSSCYSKINWKIDNFSKLNAQDGGDSDVFIVGGYKWKVRIYPKGNGKVYDHLSLYLCPVDLTKTVETVFSFAVTSQTNPNVKVKWEGKHEFPERSDLSNGWQKFMSLNDFHNPDKGYLVNDSCLITVEVTCTMKEGEWDGGSVKESGPADKVSELKGQKIKDEKQ